jgi:hypothetical protein
MAKKVFEGGPGGWKRLIDLGSDVWTILRRILD